MDDMWKVVEDQWFSWAANNLKHRIGYRFYFTTTFEIDCERMNNAMCNCDAISKSEASQL